jgi:predicted ferric reductase
MQNNMFGNHKKIFFALLIVFMGLTVSTPIQAALKDSDADGLTDKAEIEIYLTSPINADTDSDGIDDGSEILNTTNPLEKNIQADASSDSKLAWYIGRASGILAFILLTLVVVNGLLMSTRTAFRVMPPALNYEMHRFFSWMAIITVIGHFVSFTFDGFFHLTFFEGLVPFLLQRDFTSSLGYGFNFSVGIGIIAFYGILTLVVTSELRRFGFPLKKWRALHYTSFLAYILFLVHGIMAGSDSMSWWMMWIYGISGTSVIGLTALRIYLSLQKKSQAAKKAIPVLPENESTLHSV